MQLQLPPPDQSAFRLATPFPHVIVDGAFPRALLRNVLEEWPSPDDPRWIRFRTEEEEGKREGSHPAMWSTAAREAIDDLTGDEMVAWLSATTGYPQLTMHTLGGGYHESPRDAHLDTHVDFNWHEGLQLHRRLNVLLFLNPHPEGCGGELLLGDPPEVRITPAFNRLVVMATNERSWHGHPQRWGCDEPRRSLAAYGFSPEAAEPAEVHSTRWAPKP